jgi:hypothetical protein
MSEESAIAESKRELIKIIRINLDSRNAQSI